MIVRKTLSLLGVFVLLLVSACSASKKTAYGHTKGVLAKHGMVVSAKEEASKIGLSILKKGGNAFDAMVATELALAVAYPNAGNIGGGGYGGSAGGLVCRGGTLSPTYGTEYSAYQPH